MWYCDHLIPSVLFFGSEKISSKFTTVFNWLLSHIYSLQSADEEEILKKSAKARKIMGSADYEEKLVRLNYHCPAQCACPSHDVNHILIHQQAQIICFKGFWDSYRECKANCYNCKHWNIIITYRKRTGRPGSTTSFDRRKSLLISWTPLEAESTPPVHSKWKPRSSQPEAGSSPTVESK